MTDSPEARVTGLAGVELRYPLIWDPEGGADHIIEPVVQGILAPYGLNDGFPDEDSLVNEFDELSVLDRDHFTGLDRFEGSPRVNLLLRYDRISGQRTALRCGGRADIPHGGDRGLLARLGTCATRSLDFVTA